MKNITIHLSDKKMRKIYVESGKLAYEITELVKIFPCRESYEIVTVETTGNTQPTDGIFINGADKNETKRRLYALLHEESGYRPPWGILTGVRPGKIVDELLGRQEKRSRIEEIFASDYLVSPEKISLLMEVAENQENFYRRVELFYGRREPEGKKQKRISLYIGIPFCPTRCAYCSFPANEREDKAVEAYLEALFYEIEAVGKMINDRVLSVETVYIGGGTPTVLRPAEMDRLLTLLHRCGFVGRGCLEFTVEAGRPDTITADMLSVLKSHGVNRVSVNPQTMKQETLEQIGRLHTPGQTRQAVSLALASGIPIINMDLIAGLPGECAADFQRTLNEVLAFRPQNITVHTLAIKRSSRFCDASTKADPQEVEEMIRLSRQEMKKAGYGAYYLYRQKYMSGNFENTGYALPGTESGYNIRIMAEKQTIIAMGAGGISKFYFPAENRLERAPNVSNHEIYVERIDEMIRRKRTFLESDKIFL